MKLHSLIAILAVVVLTASCSEKTTLSAPIEACKACKAARTGRERTEDTMTQVCAGYDSKGFCSVWMPIYSSTTYNETRVTCDWVEWR